MEVQATFQNAKIESIYPLAHSTLLDSGTTIPIFNNLCRFIKARAADPSEYVVAGSGRVPILAWGDVDIEVKGEKGLRIFRVKNAAFCEGFACNLVPLSQFWEKGYYWDNKEGQNAIRRNYDNSLLCTLTLECGQNVLERLPNNATQTALFQRSAYFNSRLRNLGRQAPEEFWHLRLGHPGPDVLSRVTSLCRGARVGSKPKMHECDGCAMGKMKRQISRIPKEEPQGIQRFALDFSDLKEDPEGNVAVAFFTCRKTGVVYDYYLRHRDWPTLRRMLDSFMGTLRAKRVKLSTLECDNEIVRSQEGRDWLENEHYVKIEPSASRTQEQNGAAERSGGVIITKARCMRVHAKLPSFLWKEVIKAAVYLHNRLPKYIWGRWKTPLERWNELTAESPADCRPWVYHLRVYGCKAYAMTPAAQGKSERLKKLNPRAWIGYLVGYDSTNIYRIWNPQTNKVHALRDVIFDENSTFDGQLDNLRDELREVDADTVQEYLQQRTIPQENLIGLPEEGEIRDLENGSVYRQVDVEEESHERRAAAPAGGTDHPSEKAQAELLTPVATPPPLCGSILAASITRNDVECPTERPAPWVAEVRPWISAFNAGRLQNQVGMRGDQVITKATIQREMKKSSPGSQTAATTAIINRLRKGEKVHRREMPAAPKTFRERRDHVCADLFRQAEKEHLQSHREMQSWEERPAGTAEGKTLLDCMWVYVYKYNKHGFFTKCKARLVIRGDQQQKGDMEETYAATLAGRSFRTVMAIAARFNLELIQYDAVNAFVNATLEKEVYMRMPPGYRKPGHVLLLRKALYGLRESPLLWQKELTRTLREMGYSPVPHEPCCFTQGNVLIFFYVDDIVFAYQNQDQAAADRAAEQLKGKYKITGGDALQWFLGIAVVRDRAQRKIWLSQADYLEKISTLAQTDQRKWCSTPMGLAELLPHTDRASTATTRAYQRKVGSILYAAVITRPDVAFAASRLARFNMNPGPKHHEAADRVLAYLASTSTLALELGGGDTFEVSSDSSFADNSQDRRSSQAYVMRLFGGTIGWRASKQDTVTTSTTEAELLSLAQAGKEALFQSRLLKELGVKFTQQTIQLWCDNQQTIRLVNKEIAQLTTKLRHVDIHNHWLRQEVQRGHVKVDYVGTAEMVADGLTKALPKPLHQRFVRQIGLVDIEARLRERKAKELEDDTLDQLEDLLV